MSDAPRWPGTDGSPGLDFSRRRQPGASEAPEPGPGSPAPQPTPTRAPAQPESGPQPDDATAVRPAGEFLTRSAGSTDQTRGEPVRTEPTTTVAAAPEPKDAQPDTPGDGTYSVARGARRTRKARLRLARIDPWSVMKTTFLFSIAFGIMLMLAAWVLWTVFEGTGALGELNKFITTLIGTEADSQFRVEDFLNGSRVLGFTAIISAIDVVLLTALATLFAFLYNLAATVIGGLEVTLAED